MKGAMLRRLVFSVIEGVLTGLRALIHNPVRAVLTIFGVAIGVSVVVILASVMHGMHATLESEVNLAGLNSFSIYQYGWGPKQPAPLTLADAMEIRNTRGIARVAISGYSQGTLSYGDSIAPQVSLEGAEPDWFDLGGGHILSGRAFTDEENRRGAPVVVINGGLARSLFGAVNPLGRYVLVNGVRMEVIGVFRTRWEGVSGGVGDEYTEAVIPFMTAQRDFGVAVGDIGVRADDSLSRGEGIALAMDALRISHHLAPNAPDDETIRDPDEELALIDNETRTLRIATYSLASVGLFVGGTGVIAIMLIAVTERTREIGVRKALGAPATLIAWQFLVEAATMTTLGSIVGLAIGMGGVELVRHMTSIPASAPVAAVVVAVGVSVLVGMIFGTWPAVRAARLDPIEALRAE